MSFDDRLGNCEVCSGGFLSPELIGVILLHIFIDESGDKDHYVMAALKVEHSETARECIKIARTYVNEHNRNQKKYKDKWIIPEFKDANIHAEFPKVKAVLINGLIYKKTGKKEIPRAGIEIIFVSIRKASQKEKEMYSQLAIKLVELCMVDIKDACYVVFDNYNHQPFRTQLYDKLHARLERPDIHFSHRNSEEVEALQAVDIITGVIRRGLNKEDVATYEKISPLITKFEEIFSS